MTALNFRPDQIECLSQWLKCFSKNRHKDYLFHPLNSIT